MAAEEHALRAREAGATALPNAVLGTAIYLSSAVMLFAGFVSSYLVLRSGAPEWPPAGQPRLPVPVTAVNTLVLLASGFSMWRALRASRYGTGRWLGITAALGALFVMVQGFEWARLVRYGLTVRSGTYGATFYTLVGTHAVHVLGGLVVVATAACASTLGRGRLAATALYWGFVVAIWPMLYVLVYLV